MHPMSGSSDCTLKRYSDCEPDHRLSKRQRTGDNKIQKVAESSLSSQMYKKGSNYWYAEVNEPLFQKYPDLKPLWLTPTSIKLYIYEGIDTNSTPTKRIIPYCKLTKVSGHFKRVFEGRCGEMIEKQTLTLEVCGHRLEVIDWVIAELHGANKKRLNKDNVFEIYRLVDYWEIPKILNTCRTYLKGLSEVNDDLFIKTVELFAAYHDLDNLEEVIRRDDSQTKKLKTVIAIYEIMNEHECKITKVIVDWFRQSILKILEESTNFTNSTTIYKIAIDNRISGNYKNWKIVIEFYFFKELCKKLNSASESEVKKVKNEIIKNDLTFFFEEVRLNYEDLYGLLENLIDIVCLFPENVKSIIFVKRSGTKIKYDYFIEDINSKLKQFKNLEKLYFANKFPDLYLLSKLDFTQYPKLREIGYFFYSYAVTSFHVPYYYRSLYLDEDNDCYLLNNRIFADRKCPQAFENLLNRITKQRRLKTLLNKGLLTIRFGYPYVCLLTPFQLVNLCNDYNISHAKIYGLEDEVKKSSRILAAQSMKIPSSIKIDKKYRRAIDFGKRFYS